MSNWNPNQISARDEFDQLPALEMKAFPEGFRRESRNIKNAFMKSDGLDPESKQPLLQKEDIEPNVPAQTVNLANKRPNLFQKIYYYFHGYPVSTANRIIYFDQNVVPPTYFENIIRNQKYSVYTFVFVVLYNQFKFFFNFFFLMIALSQLYEPLKVGFLFTYVAPLAFVLIVTMLKEAYDDYKRYKRDKEANSQLYKVFTSNGQKIDIPSSDLKVGQIIEVRANQRIPADLVLLYTTDDSETVFLRTDQLDGETDWKLRKPIKYTQKLAKERNLYGLAANITAEPPRTHIYDFIGLLQAESKNGGVYKEPLSLEQTMWANTVLASGTIYAMVVYVGRETRMAMNSRDPRSKIGELDLELNKISKALFVFMLCLSMAIMFCKGFGKYWIIEYVKYVLLMSSIIPISLRVNLDFAKAVFSHRINTDESIEGTVARNSTIPEELGRIEFLLTDKTGTLTQNDMIFKKLCLESVRYDENNLSDMERIIKKQCGKSIGPAKDVEDRLMKETNQESTLGLLVGKKKRLFKRDKEVILRDLITALCICHNVTPVIEDGEKIFQASSPDEVALVKIAESINMKLLERTQLKMTIQNASGVKENYQILANFPFSSETKRMGIIVKHIETGRIIFYLKGADAIMKYKLPEYQRGFVLDEVEELAKMGLRTLIISQKFLTEKEFNDWNIQYEEANSVLVNRDAAVRRVVESLENDMEFLGITGVEDKLQEDVSSTIEALREAGIKIWMLTGDKVETAFCIAISAGFKSARQGHFIMKELEDPLEINEQLRHFNNLSNAVLFIDGTTLIHAFKNDEKYFLDVACKAPAVVCCRVSPTQKASITEAIKKYQKKKCCGIGDGGNDVGMIQSADVGVGIVGKEGKQAALAADYSVLKFKYIKPLLLWHGRNAYKRTAVMSQFVIHRGLIITIIQTLFTAVFYYVSIPIYNGYLMLGYTTVYTMFPVFCLIFDHDVSKSVAEAYPPLYKSLQKGRELNIKTFFIWAWKSIYQGGVIMLLSIMLFKDPYLNIVTITFSSLIVAELLNIYSEITIKKSKVLLICQVGTFAVYALSIIFMRNYINVSAIDVDFVMKVLIITLFSWVPLHVAKWFRIKLDPSEEDKLKRAKNMLRQQEMLLEELNIGGRDGREHREIREELNIGGRDGREQREIRERIEKADKEEKEEKEDKDELKL